MQSGWLLDIIWIDCVVSAHQKEISPQKLSSESTTPHLKNLCPRRLGKFGTLYIMTICPSKDKYASLSGRVYAAIKYAFDLFLQVDPSTQILAHIRRQQRKR